MFIKLHISLFLSLLLAYCALFLCLGPLTAAPARAADTLPGIASPYTRITPDSPNKTLHDEILRGIAPEASHLPPTWQRHYQELRSISDDISLLRTQLAPLLEELRHRFLQAQPHVVFLLLDLNPVNMEAHANNLITYHLEDWQWYLTDSLQSVSTIHKTLTIYSTVLHEIGEVLTKPRRTDTAANAALLDLLPELRQAHAQLTAEVALVQNSIDPWLQSALTMMENMRAARQNIHSEQPRLWLQYYIHPLRIITPRLERVLPELRAMGELMWQWETFPRPSLLVALVGVFVLGGMTMLFRALKEHCSEPPAADAPVWRHLGTLLHSQSPAHKTALAIGATCATNLWLDDAVWIHVHMPFLGTQSCLLLFCLCVWARTDKDDPPLTILGAPTIISYLLLENNAQALWMQGGMLILLGSCIVVACLQKQRSGFYHLWLAGMALCFLMTFVGFARVATVILGSLIFGRTAFVVLWKIVQNKALYQQPLQLCLILPLLLAWLYALSDIMGLTYTGLESLMGYMQAQVQQAYGVDLSLSDLLMLLALGLGLLAVAGLSRQTLQTMASRRNLLDVSAVPVIHAVFNSLLWMLFTLFALGFLGMDMRSLAFIGGALTVGIGLGLQSIISNFFSGLVIIFGRVVRGGDHIEVGTVRGRVQSVNMRATVIETENGAVLLVPNNEMLNSRLLNWTRHNRHTRESITVAVPQTIDLNKAMLLMEAVAAEQEQILSRPAPQTLLIKTEEGSAHLVLRVWVKDVDKRSSTLSALYTAVLHAFSREGIPLSTPSLQVQMQQNEDTPLPIPLAQEPRME